MLALLLLLAGSLTPASAQNRGCMPPRAPQSQLAVVYGQITDATGVPLAHAQVLLKSPSGERSYKSADENGCYSFATLPGDYSVLARSEAFRTGSVSVHLAPERAEVENLSLAVGGCTNCVQVEGAGTFAACVTDATGTPIATSDVVLTPVDLSRRTAPITVNLDDWGCGWVQPPEGTYSLSITASGFRLLRRTVTVRAGEEIPSKLKLTRAVLR
jgi:hypothetical protein